MIARALAFLALAVAAHSAAAGDALLLSPTALGPLPLTGKPAMVSVAKLRKHFQGHLVTYRIGSGDSPDFHYFEVANSKGEVLFTIKSFIDESEEATETESEVPISVLQIRSKDIRDVYGLRIGHRVKDIIAKRGKDLNFGVGHFDALIGSGNIYYSLEITDRPAGQPIDALTIEDAVKGNWQIRSLSWPQAAWE